MSTSLNHLYKGGFEAKVFFQKTFASKCAHRREIKKRGEKVTIPWYKKKLETRVIVLMDRASRFIWAVVEKGKQIYLKTQWQP